MARTNSLLLLVVLLGLAAGPALGDEVAERNVAGTRFRSARGETTAEIDGTMTGAKIHSRRRKYRLPLDPWLAANGDLLLFDDIPVVVWLLKPRFYGHLDPAEAASKPAVIFFSDEKILVRHDYLDLVKDPGAVSSSMSHTRWLKTVHPDPAKDRLRLVTQDDRELVFLIRSGNLLTRCKP